MILYDLRMLRKTKLIVHSRFYICHNIHLKTRLSHPLAHVPAEGTLKRIHRVETYGGGSWLR